MDVEKYKILESDFVGKGVSAQPNPMEKPEEEAKAVFDELVKDVVTPKFNEFVDALAGLDLTSDMEKPVSEPMQEALDAKVDKELKEGSETEYKVLSDNNFTDADREKIKNILPKDNEEPFAPEGDYQPATKKYVDDMAKAAGLADMQAAVYDPQGKKMDIFEYVDKTAGSLPSDFDNILLWKDCAYNCTKDGGTYREQWTKDGVLCADRVTEKTDDGWIETYGRYENGFLAESVQVHSWKETDGTWRKTVTGLIVPMEV